VLLHDRLHPLCVNVHRVYTPPLLCGCIHTGTQKNTLCFLNAQIYREYFFPCFPFGLLTFLILKVDTHVDVRVVRCVCVCENTKTEMDVEMEGGLCGPQLD